MGSGDWDRPDASEGEDFEREKKPAAPHPNAVAEEIRAAVRLVQAPSGFVYEYLEKLGYWRERSDDYLRALAKRFDPATRAPRRAEIVDYIKAAAYDADLTWGRVGDGEIACASGVIDVVAGTVRAHSPEHYLDSIIPHRWAPDGSRAASSPPRAASSPPRGCPRWEAALDEWFQEDAERRAALQDFFGYVCLPHAKFKRAAMLYGPSHAGKTKVLDALRALVGPEWISALSVRDLGDRDARWGLLHKRLNIVGEVGADEIMRSAGFNALVSTEEPVDVNPKYKRPMTCVLPIKIVIACNELPNIVERSGATVNRLLLIPFDHEIDEERRDPRLGDALAAEVEGIFAWAVVGAKRLVERAGRFTEVGAAAEMVADLRAEANPIVEFVAREMIAEEGEAAALIDIAQRYNELRFGRTVDARKVGRWIRAAYGAGAVRQVRHGEASARSFIGWRLAARAPP